MTVRRVAILGTGLIGASLGLALGRVGVEVVGLDRDEEHLAIAQDRGAVARGAPDVASAVDGVDVAIVAVPVRASAALVVEALDAGAPVVTDVGSAKAAMLDEIHTARPELAARFVGGHPMAGSEQDGPSGADADLFVGATWVLTPTATTDAQAYATVRSMVRDVGAEAIGVEPARHDALVARVSHVPQLAATAMMDVAAHAGDEHGLLLRLAAGGFRDMTRVAASQPAIWPDICVANRDAILAALDAYVAGLAEVRGLVAERDGTGLLELLERARRARRNLPARATVSGPLVEMRVPVPDRPAVLAEVTTLAGTLGVNIADLEIAHTVESDGGVLVLVVPDQGRERFEAALVRAGYHVSWSPLS